MSVAISQLTQEELFEYLENEFPTPTLCFTQRRVEMHQHPFTIEEKQQIQEEIHRMDTAHTHVISSRQYIEAVKNKPSTELRASTENVKCLLSNILSCDLAVIETNYMVHHMGYATTVIMRAKHNSIVNLHKPIGPPTRTIVF